MNNHHTPTRGPTTRCKSFAALLPLLDEPDMDADALAEARAHLAACAYCQQQRAAYRQLEAAATRYLSPPAAPRYRTEEIMRDLLGEPAAASSETETEAPKPIPAGRALRKPGSTRRFVSDLASLAAVLVIVVVSITLFATRARPTTGTGSGTPTPGTIYSSYTSLADISMVSPTEGWAVGSTGPCITPIDPSGGIGCQGTDPLLMRYQNGKWSRVRLSFKGNLNVISMLSATDGWAGGDKLILHYDGHTWQQMPNPDHLTLFKMQMLSDSNGWAIANTGEAEPLLNEALVHYDGHTWTAQPLPASLGLSRQRGIELNDLTMISPTEGWASGTLSTESSTPAKGSTQTAVILHYANSQWTVQSSTQGADLLSISMLSAAAGWASGFTESDTITEVNGTPTVDESRQHPFLLRYSQGKWTRVISSLDTAVSGTWQVSMVTATDGWLYGPDAHAVFHYNGQQWVKVPLPAAQNAAFVIARLWMLSATDGWAVGSVQTTTLKPGSNRVPLTTITSLILHYHDGTWSIFPTS